MLAGNKELIKFVFHDTRGKRFRCLGANAVWLGFHVMMGEFASISLVAVETCYREHIEAVEIDVVCQNSGKFFKIG